ncbi:MAG: hypothetical protein ACLGHU_09425 [Alphaproteobacteria bacterium]
MRRSGSGFAMLMGLGYGRRRRIGQMIGDLRRLYSAALRAYRDRMLHHAAMTMIIKTTALAGAGVWSWLPAAD